MGIFGALLDKLVPADENGSRGAADIILGAGGASMGANIAAQLAGAGLNDVSGMMKGGNTVPNDVVAAASENRAAVAAVAAPPRESEGRGSVA